MKLNNGKNIITDTDITMTDAKNIGHSLSDVINKLSQDIDRLNSNVKWIYKYGGVGSGAGSGSDGEPEKPWNFKVEIDEVAMVEGDTVNLGHQGEYKLGIQLYKVKGRTFTIKVTYPTESGHTSFTLIIPPTSSSKLEKILNFQYNGRVTIAINDDEGNYQLFAFDIIVRAYLFSIEYVKGDPKHSIPDNISNHNIFVNSFKETGLVVKFTLIISAEKTEDSNFTYTDWSGLKKTVLLKDNREEFYLPLGVELTNENSGNYSFLIDIHLTLLGNVEEEKIETLKLQDNLIPDSLYLKVESDGILYYFGDTPFDKVLEPENVYKFYAGAIAFRVTPFLGALNTTSNHEFKVYVNGVLVETLSELQDLLTQTIEITTDVVGENSIKFWIKRRGEIFDRTYYFWTKNPAGSFKWYPEDDKGNISVPSLGYKYVYTKSSSPYPSVKLFKDINHNYTIKKHILDIKETIYQAPFVDSKEENLKLLDLLISVGLKYNSLNDDKKELMSIQGSTSDYTIHIYLNKILYMGYEMKIYFPKDNKYHLLTFYKRAVSLVEANAQPQYELNVYIDGVLEVSNPTFIVELELYNQITLKNLLYEINLLEISYFKHKASSNPELTNWILRYNPDPKKEFPTFLNDAGILYYYYTYNVTFNKDTPEAISKIFQKSYTYASLFYVDYFSNRIKVNNTLISGINDTVNIPILMVEYTEPKGLEDDWTSDGEDIFKNWMEKGYKSHESAILKEDKPVDVYWSNGISKLNKVLLTGNFVNTHFNLTLQGTSTLMYTSKNFDLSLYNNEDTENVNEIYLFSPNYSASDPSSFLPEKRFTLKADVVDSSHSNNNALGKFINTVTTRFKEAKLPECPQYSDHIKNTLEGFPILMFFKNNYYKTKITQTLTSDIYYLGIYNFNLGRDSEFNLGYKDLRLLPENGIPEGFNLISIPVYKEIINNGHKETIDARSYLGGFGVAEVNENLAWNDFSQYDDSILFPIVPEDEEFMFAKIKGSPEIIKSGLRSLVKGISKAGGYIFESLKKNFPENGGYDVGYRSEIPKNLVTNYKKHMIRTFIDSKSLLNSDQTLGTAHDYDLRAALFGVFDERGLLIAKPVVDYRALSEYYVCCMAMGLVDSVMKNLNLRTWNNSTFYPSFYDMDTALGKDNAGHSTDYLAFSDYWKSKLKILNEELYELLPSMSYKDWCPPTVNGFDTPMTYLLAVAKYAYLYIEDDSLIEDWYPNNLWARMRRSDNKNINAWENKPVDTNNNHLGCLKDADAFINNFFKKHLEEVPDIFFNLDYRKKYFRLNEGAKSNGYRSDDIERLSGKRIYSVHDWLNGRLHILDLYFNIARVPDTIKYYDEHSETEDHFINNKDSLVYKLPKELFIDSTNQDILVKQNIFSADSRDVKYSYNIEVKFKAESDSPVSLSGSAMTQRYITGSNLNIYLLKIPSENKAVGIGGSKTWTELDKIDSLIQTHKDQSTTLYINSDKLTNLVGTSGSCNGWTITMPALQEVSLTGPNYSGTLEFKTGEKTWENLKSINISGTHLGLDLNNVKVITVKANNIISNSNLSIANCDYLSELEIQNSRFNQISLSTYNKISYFSTNKFEERHKGEKDWYDTGEPASSPKCNILNMLCKNRNGVIFINNLVYNSNGVETGLKEITLSGYKEIYIQDCPYLSKVTINDPEIVENFTIIRSSHNASSLTVGPEKTALKTLDLRQFTKLKELNFYETTNFDTVYTPDNVLLVPNAFAKTNIKYLSGKNIALSDNTFIQAWQFTALAGPEKLEGGQINLTDFSHNTLYKPGSLIGTFWGNNISLETFNAFNLKYKETLIPQLNNVTNMWGYVSGLSYSDKDLLEDYKKDPSGNTCKIDISMYKNVTNANGMLTGTNKTACHPAMLKGLGLNVSQISINNIFGWRDLSGKIITMPENWLVNIKDRVSDLNQNSLNNYIKVVNYDPIKLELVLKIKFKPIDIFPANKYISSFTNWLFEENHVIDFSNHPFNEAKYPNLLEITKSFDHCKASNLITPYHNELLNLHVEDAGFLYDITPKLTTISGSFGFSNYKSLTVNLNNFIDWLDLRYEGKKHLIINFFSYTPYWDEPQHVFEFNKTISSINNFELIYKLLLTKYTSNSLSHLFLNCSVAVDSLEKIYLPTTNNYITEIPYLFSNLLFLLDKKKLYVDWDWNILKNLPKLKNLKYAFLGMWFNNFVPFNAFNLRSSRTYNYYMLLKNKPKPEGSEEYWPKEVFVPAKYTKITYTQRIESMEGTFKNCNFLEEASYFDYRKATNLNGVNASESVTYTDLDGQLLYSEYYYSGNNSLASKIYIKHPEYDDMHLEGTNDTVVKRALAPATIQESDQTPLDYDNFSIPPDAVNCPFITPDIFYGCVNNVDVRECFAESSLNGYIPDNLFIECRLAKLTNFLRKVLIVPKVYKTLYDIDKINKYKISYYIGHNFIETTTLDYAFNFRINLPGLCAEEGDSDNTKYKVRNLFVFSFIDSFHRSWNSAVNMLPDTIKTPPKGLYFVIQNRPSYNFGSNEKILASNDSLLNIMYNHLSENPNKPEIIGELGLDINYYNKLYCDKLVNSLFMQFIFGLVFDKNSTLSSIKKLNISENNWIMEFGNGTKPAYSIGEYDYEEFPANQFAVSSHAILPIAPSSNLKSIYTRGIFYNPTTLLYLPDGAGIPVLKKLIGNSDVYVKNYLNSRSNNGWGIAFY